jgi:hypothetical protein
LFFKITGAASWGVVNTLTLGTSAALCGCYYRPEQWCCAAIAIHYQIDVFQIILVLAAWRQKVARDFVHMFRERRRYVAATMIQ